MYPIIFRIEPFLLGSVKLGPFTLHTFGLMLALGILLGSYAVTRETRRLGDPALSEERIQKLVWAVVLAVVGGGRLMHCIVRWEDYKQEPWRVLYIWEGGLVMYGGVLAVFFTVIGFARTYKINVLRLCDLVAPSAFLGTVIGRWGCFVAGDDYGKPTTSWIGVRFTDPNCLVPHELRGVPLYPTQLFMSAKCLVVALVCFWVTRRKKFDGQVAGVAFMVYPILRSIIELYRGDADRGFVGPLSTAQFTSLFVFATGLLIYGLAPRRLLADELAAAKGGGTPGKKAKKAKAGTTAA
jgi:phosphatidylglycerol:prolipoprotein diacylglycerol transferase